jgi:hypothetical protein
MMTAAGADSLSSTKSLRNIGDKEKKSEELTLARPVPFRPPVSASRSACPHDVLAHFQSALSWRAAASAVSSGFVLKAIAAVGAALWMTFTTVSNSVRLLGGSLRPPPITTQS